MNKTIEEQVRIAFTNPYSGERQDLSPMSEDDFRTALQKAYEAGQVRALEWVVKELNAYTKHSKGYRDDDTPLAKENKSGWNACLTYLKDFFHTALKEPHP